jgi:sphinganine-1-phosphate aldolase
MPLILIEHIVFSAVVIVLFNAWFNGGLHGVVLLLTAFVQHIPGYRTLVHGVVTDQAKSYTKQIKSTAGGASQQAPPSVSLPKQGVGHDELLAELKKLKAAEKDPEDSRLFAYVYTGNDEHFELQKKAFDLFTEKTQLSPEHDELLRLYREAFMHENALNPIVFPTLRRFENEVVSMTASMLNGDSAVVGCLTSGGTESLLMAVKTYRDRARHLRPHIVQPEMVAPITIHPGHEKAAHYFGVTIVHVPVDRSGRPNVDDIRNAITSNTVALLASAPQYCHGVVDPIAEIAQLAVQFDLPLHVDACFGGFMLPWVEKLGYPVPEFDFRVNGVTSISADIHKYGFGCKGASVLLYRNDSYRQYQIFAYSNWPGGLFGSPSMAGTRPGGNIAAAWAALMSMGEDGFMKVAKQLMETTVRLKEALNQIPGLAIVGQPHMTSFALISNDPEVDILAVADTMEERCGWTLERQQRPHTLHFSIMPHHVNVVDKLVADFRDCVEVVRTNKGLAQKGSAAMYGMMTRIPDNTVLDDFIVQFFNEVYKL